MVEVASLICTSRFGCVFILQGRGVIGSRELERKERQILTWRSAGLFRGESFCLKHRQGCIMIQAELRSSSSSISQKLIGRSLYNNNDMKRKLCG